MRIRRRRDGRGPLWDAELDGMLEIAAAEVRFEQKASTLAALEAMRGSDLTAVRGVTSGSLEVQVEDEGWVRLSGVETLSARQLAALVRLSSGNACVSMAVLDTSCRVQLSVDGMGMHCWLEADTATRL